jgi:TonB family protein
MVKRSISEPLSAASSVSSPECCVLENVNELDSTPVPETNELSKADGSGIDKTEFSTSPKTARELALFLVFKEIAHAARSISTAAGTAAVLVHAGVPIFSASSGATAPQVSAYLTRSSADSWKAGKPQLCQDAETAPGVDVAALRKLGVRSFIVMPVLDRDKAVTAIIEAFSAQAHGLSHGDLLRLDSLTHRIADHIELAEQTFASPPESSNTPQPVIETAQPAASLNTSWFNLERLLTAINLNVILGALTIVAALLLGWAVGRGERNRSQGAQNTHAAPAVNQLQVAQYAPEAATDNVAKGLDSQTNKVALEQEVQPDGVIPTKSSKHSTPKSVKTETPSEDLVIFEKGKQIFPLDASHGRSSNGERDKPQSKDNQPTATVSEEVAIEHLLERVEPDYPDSAREQRLRGTVVLNVRVGKRGTVLGLSHVSGDPQLSVLAAQAVRQWKFTPLLRNGAPVNFDTNITLNFVLP